MIIFGINVALLLYGVQELNPTIIIGAVLMMAMMSLADQRESER